VQVAAPGVAESLRKAPASAIVAGLAFLILFWHPLITLGRDWWTDAEAGHGLLLAPIAIFLAVRRGRAPEARSQPVFGLAILVGAVLLRYVAGLASELFTMRLSLVAGGVGLIIFVAGLKQVLHWWLPTLLLLLSIPIPMVALNSLAFPLQLKASQIGAALLDWRNVPVRLAGNVIMLPGQSLFVTEACSGLRSLTALLALGVLIGGLWLRRIWSRAALVTMAIPVAMVLNGLRVFFTGFLVFYVDPGLGEGVMHYTEGWFMFMIAFAILGVVAWGLSHLERLRRTVPA
jgi:exosortase